MTMAEPPPPPPTRRGAQAARDERLAKALRENLRRRKEQARARRDGGIADRRDPAAPDRR